MQFRPPFLPLLPRISGKASSKADLSQATMVPPSSVHGTDGAVDIHARRLSDRGVPMKALDSARSLPKAAAPFDVTGVAPVPDLRQVREAGRRAGLPTVGPARADAPEPYTLQDLTASNPDSLQIYPGRNDLMGDLRNAIGRAEAGKDGYDAHYGIGIRGYAQSNKRISQMSVAEVREFQRAMKANAANKGNAPVGRYQFVPTTLEPLLRKLGIPDTATFDAALQDRLADALLVRRGVDRFRNGEIDARTFQDNLSQEWATIAKPGRATPHRDDIHPDPAPIQAPQIQAVISGASSYRW